MQGNNKLLSPEMIAAQTHSASRRGGMLFLCMHSCLPAGRFNFPFSTFHFLRSCVMTRQERYQAVTEYFQQHMPVAETELTFDDPYELLVAVILSAQCTDKRVNMTTPDIFRKYPDVKALSKATFDDLFPLVKSISYPNNKTKHLIGMAKKVMDDFNGQIPMTVDELVLLPGVGRKTANVITSVIDNQPNMAVDTHVFRVSHRLALVPKTATTPFAVEKILVKNFPQELIHKAHHWLILHGRYICIARKPLCEKCGLKPVCPYYQQVIKKGTA
jgi:endonuclease-3